MRLVAKRYNFLQNFDSGETLTLEPPEGHWEPVEIRACEYWAVVVVWRESKPPFRYPDDRIGDHEGWSTPG
jgi:hypothetical protein